MLISAEGTVGPKLRASRWYIGETSLIQYSVMMRIAMRFSLCILFFTTAAMEAQAQALPRIIVAASTRIAQVHQDEVTLLLSPMSFNSISTSSSSTVVHVAALERGTKRLVGVLVGAAVGVAVGLVAAGAGRDCPSQNGIPCGHGTIFAVTVGGLGGAIVGALIGGL